MGVRDAFVADRTGSHALWCVRAPLRAAAWAGLRYGTQITVTGDPVPGPAVVVSNHPHVVDGLLVLMADGRLRPVARWHRRITLRMGMWVGDSIVTTTGSPARRARGAYADALAHLRAGGRVWIAPEGGCQPSPLLHRPRTGAVRLAAAVGVPLQILVIEHHLRSGVRGERWRPWRRPTITLRWDLALRPTGDVATDCDRMMRALARATNATWDPAAARPPIGSGT